MLTVYNQSSCLGDSVLIAYKTGIRLESFTP